MTLRLGVSPLSWVNEMLPDFGAVTPAATVHCGLPAGHGLSLVSGWLVVEAEQDPALAPPAPTVARAFDFALRSVMPAPMA